MLLKMFMFKKEPKPQKKDKICDQTFITMLRGDLTHLLYLCKSCEELVKS